MMSDEPINVRIELIPNTPDYEDYKVIKRKSGLTISTEIVRHALKIAADEIRRDKN